MTYKSRIMDAEALNRAVVRISHEIIEKNHGTQDLCLIGIRRRGVPLAGRMAAVIGQTENVSVPVGVLDITLYRDDLTSVSDSPTVNATEIPFSVSGKRVVLVDDVIYTGRTARAAIEALFSLGRPACIQLAVLIDRGHRELPIRPDFVGKNIPTSRSEMICVNLPEFDGETGVTLYDLM
jgi:pyrimidine operon attenuation protein/uracil phosphoribosyltransferase